MSQLPQGGLAQSIMPGGAGAGGNFQAPVIGAGALGMGIAGTLPWGAAGGAAGMFGADLAGSYASAYNSALQMNQANYQNILKGYQDTLANQQGAQAAIGGGYNDLYNAIQGKIQGIDQSQRQALADQYANIQGNTIQGATSKGLGNTTVLNSLQRGNNLDFAKAGIALSNQTAALQAGYMGQIGGAALNYASAAAMQNTALSNQQLQWMNSVNAGYPNADAYTKLYQQQGAIGQANADRTVLQDQLNKLNPYAGRGMNIGPGAGGAGPVGQRHAMPGMDTGVGGGQGPAGFAPPMSDPNAPLNQLTAQYAAQQRNQAAAYAQQQGTGYDQFGGYGSAEEMWANAPSQWGSQPWEQAGFGSAEEASYAGFGDTGD